MLKRSQKIIGLLVTLSLLMSCSKLDDYMLGKDNTPNPKALEPINSKVKITQKWSVPTGLSKKNTDFLKLKPITIGHTIYTADTSGTVQAVNKANGNLIWSKNIGASIISGPTVAEGHVVVGTDTSKVVALNEANGNELWQSHVSGDVLGKPVIAANKVIAKTIDGNLYALDIKTGNKLWLAEHGAPSLILKASSSPVIVNNKLVLVGYSDGKLEAVDLHSGHVLWQRSIAFASGASDVERLVDIDADPIVQGDTVFLASYQGYVGAFSINSGQFIWRKPASTFKNIVVKGQTLYMTDSSDILWSINKENGHVNWKQVNLAARGLTEPELMGDKLIVADKTGMLHVISTKNGEFISRIALGGAVHIAPGVSGNNIYVMTSNGKLSRFSVS